MWPVLTTATRAVQSGWLSRLGTAAAFTAGGVADAVTEKLIEVFGGDEEKLSLIKDIQNQYKNAGIEVLKEKAPHLWEQLGQVAVSTPLSRAIVERVLEAYAENDGKSPLNAYETALVLGNIRRKLEYLEEALPGGIRTVLTLGDILTTDKQLLEASVLGTRLESYLDEISNRFSEIKKDED